MVVVSGRQITAVVEKGDTRNMVRSSGCANMTALVVFSSTIGEKEGGEVGGEARHG